MKKVLTGIMTLSLVASMSIPTFAVTNDGTAGTVIDVNGTYQAAETSEDVVSVDIAGDNMDFTYTAGSKGTWNAYTHQYDNPTEGGWAATSGTDPKITVTNHSNLDVQANLAFNGTVDGLNGSFTKTALALDSAEGTELSNAPKDETAFSVSGAAIDADKSLGTITVTVKKAGPATISSAEELLNSAATGGTFRLANDIALDENTKLEFSGKNYSLDLNGFTLSGSCYNGLIHLDSNSKVTIKNGTVWNKYSMTSGIETFSSELVLEDCTVHSYFAAVDSANNSSVYATNCSFQIDSEEHVTLLIHNSTLTLSGSVNMVSGGGLSNQGSATTKALPGTYNFDVTSYVDTDIYNVTDDGKIWTVTEK